ncbi:MAG: diguanylate cyclase [Oscillospiraceae bacterium]|nr:diguanylate cyclase [Oscillospiraceae bacterium]
MGLIDTLSGVYNRNAMNNRIDEYYSKKIALPYSIGVVFADINGLKRVNDQEGHQAGDRLIQSAAQLLKDAFSGYDIYPSVSPAPM